MVNNDHIEDKLDVASPFMNGGTQEGGEQVDRKRKSCQKNMKKYIVSAVIFILLVILVALIIAIIIQAGIIAKLRATPCPSGWSQHGDCCYSFSDKQWDWNSSHHNCSSETASLITLDSEEEWALIKSKKNEYWINLQRQETDQPWKWPNGSITQVKGPGLCGYVVEDEISSTNCDSDRHWVCRKPVHAA